MAPHAISTTVDLDERKHTSLWQNRKCILLAFILASAGFQYGLDTGLINAQQAMVGWLQVFGYADPASPIGWNVRPLVQQLMSSLQQLGAFCSAGLAGLFSTYFGRRTMLWTGCLICSVGAAVLLGTTSIPGLYIGRFMVGFANGMFMSNGFLYLQEVAPPQHRGVFLGLYSIWIALGSLIGGVITNYTAPLAGRVCYQIPLGLLYPVPLVLSVALVFIPESPRWLAMQERYEQAGNALRRLRGSSTPNELVEAELQEIIATDKQEKEMAHGVSWFDLFRGTNLRRTALSVATVCCQGATGSIFFIIYGTYFFEVAGVGKPFQDTVVVNCVGLLAICVSFFWVRLVGRRMLIAIPTTFVAFTMLGGGLAWTLDPNTAKGGDVLVAMVVIFIFFYQLGVSPYSWLIGGELPSQRLRAHTLGLATSLAFLLAWVTIYTAPDFVNPGSKINWGAKYCYIWFVSNLVIVAYVLLFLPETKGRTLAEIDEMFEARLKPWEFKNYVCKGIQVQEPTAAAGALHSYGQEEAYGNKMDDEQVENIPMKTEQPIATVNYR